MIDSVFPPENCFSVKNIKIYQPTIIFTKNAEIKLFCMHDNITIPPHAIAFIEKGVNFNVMVLKKETGIPYKSVVIDNATMMSVHQLFETAFYRDKKLSIQPNRTLKERVIFIEKPNSEDDFFCKIHDNKEDLIHRSCKLAYILSMLPEKDKLFISMTASIVKSFSDKVRSVIEERLDKKWKLSDIAEKFHCSEITVRKKLEKENITFNQLVYDIRMKNAAKLILSTDCNVAAVAAATGILSTSYFIKQFKSFFGMTPKKYYLNFIK
ncbi:helix-turn-helix transcriptional regulator [Escherichia albertii]|uniref:AraC family transcriptional regulator n=1 Tax=Escherichia albertii TaxID=208962 RepID=UPI000743CA05|nr:response regulator transcription factor [Escherichia albertii]EEW7499324.1 AraC family transcriptional regulator [Escherichia albertii]EFJ2288545.1 AraC family transcriptional regulator [Escherichia albertii]EFO0112165.1 AraC family transcriptional regulator [Escherichia albertii]MCU7297296.1 AraC family transcriptional regulator [Escherichia albertii]MCU7306623.1 AraC family transcriptional regulator [Escherichia albertii]